MGWLPMWVLRDFTPVLAAPTCSIFNASIRESVLPTVWTCTTVVPIPKSNPSPRINLRSISLTPILSKELEYFVCQWIMEAVGDRMDQGGWNLLGWTNPILAEFVNPRQCACTGGPCAWLGCSRTDSSNIMIRAVLPDYRKAFDLIDQHILLGVTI